MCWSRLIVMQIALVYFLFKNIFINNIFFNNKIDLNLIAADYLHFREVWRS